MAALVGKVGIVMKGAWSSSSAYEVLDAVSYDNGLYIAKQAVPANTVPTNTTYWQLAVNTGYPKTVVNITPEEGFTIVTNRSYRINDIVIIDIDMTSQNAITSRTRVGKISDAFGYPKATTRFICPGSASEGGTLGQRTNGYIDIGGAIRIGDDGPNIKDFHIAITYVV